MKITFAVDRIAALKAGVNADYARASLEIDPAQLTQEQRDKLVGRLNNELDVCSLVWSVYANSSRFHRGSAACDAPLSRIVNLANGRTEVVYPDLVVARMPTLDALLEAIDAENACVAEETRKAWDKTLAERARRLELTKEAFADGPREMNASEMRVVRDSDGIVRKLEAGVSDMRTLVGYAPVNLLKFDWPYQADEGFTSSPEVLAAVAELDPENERRTRAAFAAAVANLEAKERQREEERAAAVEAENDKVSWIAARGSERLKRLVAEGIKHDRVYRHERLAAERPGWRFRKDVRGDSAEPCNSAEEAFEVLDEARKLEPAAKLVYWQIEREDNEDAWDGDDDDGTYTWRGYAAKAEFLGQSIVFGVPEEYVTA